MEVWEQHNRRSSFCSPHCAGFAEPWAQAAGLPSALPVLKLLSIQLFKALHQGWKEPAVSVGGGWVGISLLPVSVYEVSDE